MSNVCRSIILEPNLKIVFGASDDQRGFETLGTKLHPKTEVIKGVLAQECGNLMVRFFPQDEDKLFLTYYLMCSNSNK